MLTGTLYTAVLLNTFFTAALVTVCCLLVGYPLAYLMNRTTQRRAMLILLLVTMSFWTSFLVRTYAWMVLLGNNGPVIWLIEAMGVQDPPGILFTRFSSTLAMVHILAPYMIMNIYSVMQKIDRSLIRSAESMGAYGLSLFRHIYLPLTAPGIANGSVLVFVICLGFYVTPVLLGSPREQMIAGLIGHQIDEFLAFGMGSALAMILLLMTLIILLWIYSPPLRPRRLLGMGAAMNRFHALDRLSFVVSYRRAAGHRGADVVLHRRLAAIPAAGVGWGYYAPISPIRAGWCRPSTAFLIASATTVLTMLLVVPATFALVRHRFRGRAVADIMMLMPLAVPSIVMAVGYYSYFGALGLVHSHLGVILAHTCLSVPITFLVLSANLKGFDRTLERAAMSLGASPTRTFIHVTLPILRPGLIISALFAFVQSFDETVVAIFISGRGAETLPRKMFDSIRQEADPVIAVISTLLFVAVLIGVTTPLAVSATACLGIRARAAA